MAVYGIWRGDIYHKFTNKPLMAWKRRCRSGLIVIFTVRTQLTFSIGVQDADGGEDGSQADRGAVHQEHLFEPFRRYFVTNVHFEQLPLVRVMQEGVGSEG